MSKASKSQKFQLKLFTAAKWQLDKLTQGFPIPIELRDLSIYIERIRMEDNAFKSHLDPCCEEDMKIGEDFYVEAELKIQDREVVSSYIIQIEPGFEVVIEYSKIEIFYLTEEEKEKFKKKMPEIDRPLQAINKVFVTNAIRFGILWALGKL